MRERIKIFEANNQDIHKIVDLIIEGNKEISDMIIYGCEGIYEYVRDNLYSKSYKYYVAKLNNIVVGTIEYKIIEDSIHLNYIVLDRSIRGIGFSEKFISESLKMFSYINKITLDVFTNNEVAIKLYHKLGFHIYNYFSWNIISLKNTALNSKYRIVNIEENKRKFNKYGFSFFSFIDDDIIFNIGIIGKKWVRITDEKLLNNPNYIAFIINQLPGRSIYSITNSSYLFNPCLFTINQIKLGMTMEKVLNNNLI